MNDDDLQKQASTPHASAIVIGDEVHYPMLFADNKPYVFNRKQMEFLIALENHKSIDAASAVARVTKEWAKGFLASRKFKSFRSGLLMEASIRNGATISWWYEFGVAAANGKREWYEATCKTCTKTSKFTLYEAEQCRQDDMTFKGQCPLCYEPVTLESKSAPFTPTREAVVAWQEIGARLIPKIERVHHEFEKAEFVFQPAETA